MLLTIDVGNTSISGAVFKGKNIIYKRRLITPGEISVRFIKKLLLVELNNKITDVMISSVVPDFDEPLAGFIKNLFGKEAFFLTHKTNTEIKIKIDSPEELGADRIADSVGALHFFNPPYIVIDSGTATTFDVVNRDYEYIGGSIFPGIELSIKSLAENTAKLKMINFSVPKSLVGTTTENSIKSGIYFSYIGGLSYMIDEYKMIVGSDSKVIATGGLTKYFKNKIKNIDLFESDLVHYGLKIIHNKIGS